MLTYEAPLTGSPDQGHIVVHQLVHKYSLSRQIFPFGSMALDILCMGLTKFHKDGPQISVCFESTLPNICKSVALHTKDEFVKASTLGIPCLFLAIDYRVSLECTIGNDAVCMVHRALQSQCTNKSSVPCLYNITVKPTRWAKYKLGKNSNLLHNFYF